MAIDYARVEFVKRSAGKNVVHKSAYFSRSQMYFEGNCVLASQTYDYTTRGGHEYHEVMLPKGVDERYKNAELLWNYVEAREDISPKKYRAQVAMEGCLALPRDAIVTDEDRIELVRSYVQKRYVDQGLAVQIDIHNKEVCYFAKGNKELGIPQGTTCEILEEDENSYKLYIKETKTKLWMDMEKHKNSFELIKGLNPHAHLLITTRRFDKEGYLGAKARDLMPKVREGKFGERVVEAEKNNEPWRAHQDEYFERMGWSLRVDDNGLIPEDHLGPARFQRYSELLAENERRKALNRELSSNPEALLQKITEKQAVFTKEEVQRYLAKHVPAKDLAKVQEQFWQNMSLVQLRDKSTQEFLQKFSSKEVLEEDRSIFRLAQSLRGQKGFAGNQDTSMQKALNNEQYRAFKNVLSREMLSSGSSLALIQGYAGTGKSYLLRALYDAYQDKDLRVRGLGPDNATARVLEGEGILGAENVKRFLFGLSNEKRHIEKNREVWIVDEAGKLDNPSLRELLSAAVRHKAQLILSGDAAQLPSVGRGGMFKYFCDTFGAEKLNVVQRQKVEAERRFVLDLAHGQPERAIANLEEQGKIVWCKDTFKAMEGLISKWAASRRGQLPGESLLIAHQNKYVAVLNEMAREVRKQSGELGSKEFRCEVSRGKVLFISENDLIEFRSNDKELGVTNGMRGVLVKAKAEEFVVSVKEGPKKERLVQFNPKEFGSFDLGYVRTNFRAQGMTVERAYVLHDKFMGIEGFYVALSRHRGEVHLFVGQDQCKDMEALKRDIRRSNAKETSLPYLTTSDLELAKAKEERAKHIEKVTNQGGFGSFKGLFMEGKDKVVDFFQNWVQRSRDQSQEGSFYRFEIAKEEKFNIEEIKPGEIQGYGLEKAEKDPSKVIDIGALAQREGKLNERALEKAFTQNREFLKEQDFSVEQVRKQAWEKLDGSKRESLQSYFQSTREASELRMLCQAQAEAIGIELKQARDFSDWQKAVGKRYETAYLLEGRLTKEELQSCLGDKSAEFVAEQAMKHKEYLERKEAMRGPSIEGQLKENMDALLYRLFPEGPTYKDAKSYRYGAKGSISVTHSGDKAGRFYNFERDEGGGLVKLIEQQRGMNFSEAKSWAKDFLGEVSNVEVPRAYCNPKQAIEIKDNWVSVLPRVCK